MGKITAKVEEIADKIRTALSVKDEAREKALPSSREAVRYCSEAIRAVHRGEYDEARKRLSTVRQMLDELNQVLKDHPDLRHSGFVYTAQKEYAEGCATLSLITDSTIPDPDELGVDYAAYMNGIAEAVGELRRHILDLIRKGDIARCEELLEAMDDIYGVLVTMDFPDALTGGLRRTTDTMRSIMERTRGDLTVTARQWELEDRLDGFEKKLK
jgi:translin